jgi:hypothetical protein
MIVDTENALNGTTMSDILNENGGLVLPEGVVLSKALIQALINQNIPKVDVSLPDENNVENTADTEITDQEFTEHVDTLFIRHRGQFMKEFKECILKIKRQNSANG